MSKLFNNLVEQDLGWIERGQTLFRITKDQMLWDCLCSEEICHIKDYVRLAYNEGMKEFGEPIKIHMKEMKPCEHLTLLQNKNLLHQDNAKLHCH